MQTNDLLKIPGRILPAIAQLPVFDLWGVLVSVKTIVNRGLQHKKHFMKCTSVRNERQEDYDAYALFEC